MQKWKDAVRAKGVVTLTTKLDRLRIQLDATDSEPVVWCVKARAWWLSVVIVGALAIVDGSLAGFVAAGESAAIVELDDGHTTFPGALEIGPRGSREKLLQQVAEILWG